MTHHNINSALSVLMDVPDTLSEYTHNLDACACVRRHIVVSQEDKVKFLNTLRAVVGRRCPVNKVGLPIVTDYDLIDATPMEICETILRTKNLWT